MVDCSWLMAQGYGSWQSPRPKERRGGGGEWGAPKPRPCAMRHEPTINNRLIDWWLINRLINRLIEQLIIINRLICCLFVPLSQCDKLTNMPGMKKWSDRGRVETCGFQWVPRAPPQAIWRHPGQFQPGFAWEVIGNYKQILFFWFQLAFLVNY